MQTPWPACSRDLSLQWLYDACQEEELARSACMARHGMFWRVQVRLADTMQLTGLHAGDNAELLQLRSQARIYTMAF